MAPVGSPTAGSVVGVLAVVNGTGGVLLAGLRTRVTLTATAGGGGGGQLTLTWTTPSSPDPQVAVAPWDGSLPLSLRLTWVGGVVGAQAALPGGGWVAVGGPVQGVVLDGGAGGGLVVVGEGGVVGDVGVV